MSELREVEDTICVVGEQLLAEDGISQLALAFACFGVDGGLTSCRLVIGPGGPGGPGGPEILRPSSPLSPFRTFKGR